VVTQASSHARSDSQHLVDSGEIVMIAGTFGHEGGTPQAAPPIYTVRFQTEALPTATTNDTQQVVAPDNPFV